MSGTNQTEVEGRTDMIPWGWLIAAFCGGMVFMVLVGYIIGKVAK
jgi:hypothetical protein